MFYRLNYAHHNLFFMARPAGLEPATLGLEGRCSIRLSYGRLYKMVGVDGFEPPTHCSQSSCATRLRYTPTVVNHLPVKALNLKEIGLAGQ